MGKITLPSTILQFWDLGGQRGIRSIWHRYYDDCHAVVFVLDAQDRERLGEGWEVFGTRFLIQLCNCYGLTQSKGPKTTFCPIPRYSASHYCCSPINRTARIASPSKRYGTTTRNGIVASRMRHAGDMETRSTWNIAGTGWPVSMSWAYPHWKGEHTPYAQCTHGN